MPQPVDLPRTLGPYLLLHRLGQGGMGEVFLCKQAGIQGIEHYGVIKAVREDQAESAEAVGRFLDEAAVLVHLSHRNICQVSRVGRADGDFYVAMELIAGRHLGEVITALQKREAPMPESTGLFVLGEVVAALDYAHRLQHPVSGEALGIVHRDVSPQNVMVSFEGEVKLIDFGLARSSLKREQTARGVRVGKIAYMSPEQMRSEPLDERTDQYAAAVLGYELLTNRRFYSGLAGDALFQAVGRGGYVPAAWTDLDGDVRSVLGKALHPDPQWRYESCAAFRRELATMVKRRGLFADGEELRTLMGELFPDGPSEQRGLLQRFATFSAPDPNAEGNEFEEISSAGHVIPATRVGPAPIDAASTVLEGPAASTEVLLSNPHAAFSAEAPLGAAGVQASTEGTAGVVAPRSVPGLTTPHGDSIPDRSSLSGRSSGSHSAHNEWEVERTEIVGRYESAIQAAEPSRLDVRSPTPPSRPPTALLAAAGAVIVVLVVAIAALLLGGDDPAAVAVINQPTPTETRAAQSGAPGFDSEEGDPEERDPEARDPEARDPEERDPGRADPAGSTGTVEPAPDVDALMATNSPSPPSPPAEPAAMPEEAEKAENAENAANAEKAESPEKGKPGRVSRDRGRRAPAPRKARSPPPTTDPVSLFDKVKVLEWCRGKEGCAKSLLKRAPRVRDLPLAEQRGFHSDLDRCVQACLR